MNGKLKHGERLLSKYYYYMTESRKLIFPKKRKKNLEIMELTINKSPEPVFRQAKKELKNGTNNCKVTELLWRDQRTLTDKEILVKKTKPDRAQVEVRNKSWKKKSERTIKSRKTGQDKNDFINCLRKRNTTAAAIVTMNAVWYGDRLWRITMGCIRKNPYYELLLHWQKVSNKNDKLRKSLD